MSLKAERKHTTPKRQENHHLQIYDSPFSSGLFSGLLTSCLWTRNQHTVTTKTYSYISQRQLYHCPEAIQFTQHLLKLFLPHPVNVVLTFNIFKAFMEKLFMIFISEFKGTPYLTLFAKCKFVDQSKVKLNFYEQGQ